MTFHCEKKAIHLKIQPYGDNQIYFRARKSLIIKPNSTEMKKLLLIAMLFLIVSSGQAQLSFGVKGGINVSNVVGKDVEGYRSKLGIHLGGFGSLSLTPTLGVQAELLYSSQGAKWDDDDEKTSLGYIQVPVLVRYNFAGGFYAEAGPQLGFLVKAKDDNEGDVYDIKEYLEKIDVAIALGAGYNLNSNLGVYARYTAGLTKFYDEEKNAVFQVGVAYRFGKL